MTRAARRQPAGLGVVIAATSLGFVLVQLDVSIVNVALVRIGEALGTGVTGLQWVVDSYAIAFAGLLLSAGALGDRIGALRAYGTGFALFVLASLGCGLAPDIATLLAARTAQGIGAALLVPCSLALLTHACGEDKAARTHAISLWTAAASVALAAGPVLGGVLVDSLGWRSIFLVNVPLGLAGIWLTLRFVRDTRPAGGGFDPAGQALAVITLLSLTGAVIEAGRLGPGSPLVLAGFAIAALGGLGFVLIEARNRDPMLPLPLFRNPTFSASTAVGLAINLTLYGTVFVLGIYLQRDRGYSPTESGLALLPLPVAVGLGNLAAGPIGNRLGPRLPMVLGLALGALGDVLLRPVGAETPYAVLAAGLVVMPAGIGLAVPAMTTALLSTVPRARSGVASGVLNTVRQAGGGIGIALFGALMAGRGVAAMPAIFTISAALLAGGAVIALCGVRPPPRRMVSHSNQASWRLS